MNEKDGGPAFPTLDYEDGRPPSPGMSLRDYFAAHALAAYVAANSPASDEDGEFAAEYAYELADAMIAHRAAWSPSIKGDG
jgi:hypothetical protein